MKLHIPLIFLALSRIPTSLAFRRIINGTEVLSLSGFPYQAILFVHVGESSDPSRCGATLISDKFLLTAAHCVTLDIPLQKVVVGMGVKDVANVKNNPGSQWDVVKEGNIFPHDHYHKYPATYNDIALIKLTKPVKFSEIIQPIPLVPYWRAHTSFYQETGTVSGYGQVQYGESSKVLRYAQVRITQGLECQWSPSYRFMTAFCAVAIGGQRPSAGDSGSPLAYTSADGNSKFLIGIYSTSQDTQDPKGYHLFTKVGDYLQWIKKISNVVPK